MSGPRHDPPVDRVRLGRTLRTIRRRLGLRQVEVARRAALSQQAVSAVERGAGQPGLPVVEAVASALGASLEVSVRWRGPDLDRIADAAHVGLVATTVARLRRLGFEAHVEVSYSEYGERGSIDVVGIDRHSASVVIGEVKSDLTTVEGTIRKHDEKIRLAPTIVRRRFGMTVRRVVGLLVLSSTMTARRRVVRYATVLDGAYPLRGDAAWAAIGRLATGEDPAPTHGGLGERGLVFLSDTTRGSAGDLRTPSRISGRRRRSAC